MRRLRPGFEWISGTTTGGIIFSVVVLLMTMVLTVQSSLDDILNENVPLPEFLPGAANVTVREGDVAILPCAVRNLGTKQVVWRRTDLDKFLTIGTMTWADDNNVSMDHSRKADHVSNWNLIIQHVKHKDAGLYECQVTSKIILVRNVTLNVVGPPITKPDSSQLSREGHSGLANNIPNVAISVCGAADLAGCLISITGKQYVDLGERISLTCNASGGPRIPDEIDWFKGGDKIDTTKYKKIILEKHQDTEHRAFISELIIEYSKLTDTGDYICRSSRNDIANLKVTVLHADSSNVRRGSGPFPNTGEHQDYENKGQRNSPHELITFALTGALTLFWSYLSLFS